MPVPQAAEGTPPFALRAPAAVDWLPGGYAWAINAPRALIRKVRKPAPPAALDCEVSGVRVVGLSPPPPQESKRETMILDVERWHGGGMEVCAPAL